MTDNETEPEVVETTEIRPKTYTSPELAETADDFNMLWKMAGHIAGTEFVPAGLRGSPAKVFAAMLTARGLGVDPMTGLREIGVIDGKPNMSAEFQRGLVLRAGHTISGTADSEKAEVTGRRADTKEEMTITYTLEDAVQAGHVELKDGKPYARSQKGKVMPWERHTEAMLYARATTLLVRRLFPDVLIGEAL